MPKEDLKWYSEDAKHKISQNELISLYERYHESMHEAIIRHHNNRNYYTVILTALFGLFVKLFIDFQNPMVGSMTFVILECIPAGIFLLYLIALRSSDRYYRGFLERVVLVAKTEHLLGLDKPVKTEIGKPSKIEWGEENEKCKNKKRGSLG